MPVWDLLVGMEKEDADDNAMFQYEESDSSDSDDSQTEK